MNFLNDDDELNLDLPKTADIDRNLFANEVEKFKDDPESQFDVDKFLMQNNFHYLNIDPLIRDLSGLSNDIMSDLLEQVSTNYEYYLSFFKTYNAEDNETLIELQNTKNDIEIFMNGLEQLTGKDIRKTQEVITDTVEYLRKLDEISSQLKSHKALSEDISLSKEYSRSLHGMCGIEDIEELICSDLIQQLHKLVTGCETLLTSLESLNSPLVHHFYNEYQGLIQEFQISLKILTDKCLSEPTKFTILSKTLVSLLESKPIKV